MISRGQMSFQISTPPEGRSNGKEKEKARRLRKKGQGEIQGLALGLRKRSSSQVPKSGSRQLGKLY